jgi:hypothetical protein
MTCQDMVDTINEYLNRQKNGSEAYLPDTRSSCLITIQQELQRNNIALLRDCFRREGVPEVFLEGAAMSDFYKRR